MREIDVNGVRDPLIAMNGLTGTDGAYTFYYDETNNIRRLHVTADGLNVRDPMCFVLGGVAHRGPPRQLDIASLRAAVHLQPSAPELKLHHLGRGDILGLLTSARVEAYLDWLVAEDLLIHYSAVDPLYWATVDIVDSIISHRPMAHMQMYAMMLKSNLFMVLAADIDDIADLFHRYHYPDVGETARIAFVFELLDRLEERKSLLNSFEYMVLKGVLQAGARKDRLIYLEDEEPDTLLDSFVEFFIHRICLFKNARHMLDVEPQIEEPLRVCVFKDGARTVQNFTFVDSKADPGIQASDAIVGLLGKLFSYVTRTSLPQLIVDREALTPDQLRRLAKLNALIDQSQAESPALLHWVAGIAAMHTNQVFLEGP